MKLKYFGTAAAEGVPALYCDCDVCEQARKLKGKDFRTRSQSMVNDDLLIDYPADTYMHVLNHGLPLHKIKHLIVTHAHSDHLYVTDLTMMRPGYATRKDTSPVNIHGSSAVVKKLRSSAAICEMEENKFIIIHEEIAFKPFEANGYKITPLEADHHTAEVPFIYIIEKDGKAILYAHDTGYFPESTMKYLEETKPRVDFATFDCCFSLRHKDRNHLGFDEVMIMKSRLEEIGVIDNNTICCVNHFSHNGGELYENMKNHSEKFGILTSYDGMEVEF